jgi:hypothetical protein
MNPRGRAPHSERPNVPVDVLINVPVYILILTTHERGESKSIKGEIGVPTLLRIVPTITTSFIGIDIELMKSRFLPAFSSWTTDLLSRSLLSINKGR